MANGRPHYGSDVAPVARKTAAPPLSLAEHVCLVLVQQGASHGWAVGTLLAPDGEVGRIWSLSRPLTYRALEQLADKELVRRSGEVKASGRDRQLLAVTPKGRRLAQEWLDAPVEHLREVRTDLLLKLALGERDGRDVEPLLRRQEALFADRISSLTSGTTAPDLVSLWRSESARAVRRFLTAARSGALATPERTAPRFRISARNQLTATVSAITHGEVMSTVRATLGDGQNVTAAITKESIQDLDLAIGDEVIVVVKSTEVMIAKE
jgi:molybdopterin-binding protein